MIRAVVDTNVWISALLNPAGHPARVLDAFAAGDFVAVPLVKAAARGGERFSPEVSESRCFAEACIEQNDMPQPKPGRLFWGNPTFPAAGCLGSREEPPFEAAEAKDPYKTSRPRP